MTSLSITSRVTLPWNMVPSDGRVTDLRRAVSAAISRSRHAGSAIPRKMNDHLADQIPRGTSGPVPAQ